MNASGAAARRAPSRRLLKKLLLSSFAVVLTIGVVELGLRVYFAFTVGPSVLLYGTPFNRTRMRSTAATTSNEARNRILGMTQDEWRANKTVMNHEEGPGEYTKYRSHQKRVDFDVETGEKFDVTINSRGFRGRDFEVEKLPGTQRIVTLGASSTFGYFVRDDETYPHHLQQLLDQRAYGGKRYEVINLGIPHLDSSNLVALFHDEALPLAPDVVTYYEGNNDVEPMQLESGEEPLHRRVMGRAANHSILAGLADSILFDRRLAPFPTDFEPRVAAVRARFLGNLERIADECALRGIVFIVSNQQKNSQTFERAERKGLTYEAEAQAILRRIAGDPLMTRAELRFLAHRELMRGLREWAQARHVPFIDAIAALDDDRSMMVSWVHLSSDGNRKLAAAFADAINLAEQPRAAAGTEVLLEGR